MHARGVDGCAIFRDDDDRVHFVTRLGESKARHGGRVLAFCLMTTHYHLVVQTRPARLSKGIHRLQTLHAMQFNRRHERFGHLFADRFSAKPIEHEEGLKAVCRYVMLNPVRAGMVATAWDWPWSAWEWGRFADLSD